MNRFLKTAVLSTAVAATVLAPLAQASAADRHRQPVVVQPSNQGDLVLAGILGLAVGAIAAGVIASDPAPVPIEIHREPAVRPSLDRDVFYEEVRPDPEPEIVYYDDTEYAPGYEPWSRDWYRYCARTYDTFDPVTGTYLTGRGEELFCVAD